MCREEILACLKKFDTCFDPPFSSSVDLTDYADKLFDNAYFIIALMNESIVGMIAYYKNEKKRLLYIPYFVVDNNFQGCSLGTSLLKEMETRNVGGSDAISLEVLKSNRKAYSFYKRNGFRESEDRGIKFLMVKGL
jgi:ribosomal protein S18 acetylase RimI-like enzyme